MNQGSLKPEGYLPRIADDMLAHMLDTFGAVEVTGTMWCGKTWTSLAYGESVTRVSHKPVRTLAEADPSSALIGNMPHVIDEWQEVPSIWDAVRDSVDERPNKRGAYILTGSSNPRKGEVAHSGAGRIAKLRMRTMTLQEMGLSTGSVSLSRLFDGQFEPQLVQQKLAPLADVVCRGGWPALVNESPETAGDYLDSYFDALFDVSISRRGLDGRAARAVARSLARNLGSAVKMQTVGEDAFSSSLKPETVAGRASAYISALEELYVVEPLRGWDAPIRSKSRLRTKPKHYFADPSLAASLLEVSPNRLLSDGQLFGVLFESLCVHDVSVYAQAIPGAGPNPLHYYRDSDGLEVDMVIELRDGRWAPIEVKLGDNKVRDAIASLARLRAKVASNPAARNPSPSFSAVIVGAGELARYDREGDAYVVPITALGA